MALPKNSIIVRHENDEVEMVGRPCELSAYSFIPTHRNTSPEKTFFNSTTSVSTSLYSIDFVLVLVLNIAQL